MKLRPTRQIGPICLILILLACHLASGTASAQLTRLKTSYSALTANMAAYWLAKEAKIFEKHGLNVDVVLIESGVTTVQALTAGETQIAMGGGTVAVSSNLAGSDVVTIATPTLGALVNRVSTSDAIPPWQFGTGALMRSLAARGLL